MKSISLKLDESIFSETEKILKRIRMSRNKYINDAISYYNKVQNRALLAKRFEKESSMVREESMNVLKDFEDIDYVD